MAPSSELSDFSRLKQEEAKANALFASIGDGAIATDEAGHIFRVNHTAIQLLGFSEAEVMGAWYQRVLIAEDENGSPINPIDRPITQALLTGSPISTRLFYRTKSGDKLPVAITVSPILLDNRPIGAIEIFRDITHERQLEQAKDEFLSIASHELRTPMGAIRAFTSMILAGDYGPVNDNLIEPLTDIKTSAVRLVDLVNDMLAVARIEAGRMQFTLTNFDIRAALQEIVNNLAPLGKEQGIQVTVSPGTSVLVQADADKVKQVLINLIGNALKFTDQGTITVSAHTKKDVVEITVTDTGIGLTKADQKKLFGKFVQIFSAQEGKPAGTGLGLYISRQIIMKMGGELWLKSSAPGKGSVFALTLARSNTASARKAKEDIEGEANLHPDQK